MYIHTYIAMQLYTYVSTSSFKYSLNILENIISVGMNLWYSDNASVQFTINQGDACLPHESLGLRICEGNLA